MPITMEDDYKGRSGTKLLRKLKFLVRGSDDDAAIRAHVESNVPPTHDGLVARAVSSMKQESDQIWRVTVDYGALSLFDVPTFDPGTASYTFDVQVEPETFYYSVDRQGKWPANAPEVTKGLVGIQPADGGGRHSGVYVPAGPVTDVVTYEYPAAVIPSTYRNTVRELIGGANDATFLGGAAGTMRFVACSASVTSSGRQTISFRFAYRPARTVTVGGLAIGSVDGWDSVWTIDETTILTDGDGKDAPLVTPIYAYKERFVPRVSFSGLGLPAL